MTRWQQLLAEVDRVLTYGRTNQPVYLTRAMRDEVRLAVVLLIEEQETADAIADACDQTGIDPDDDVPAHIRRLAWRARQARRIRPHDARPTRA